MKRMIFAAFAVLLFTATTWAQTPVRPEARLVRVSRRSTRHRAHAHRRHEVHHHSHRRHSA